MSDLVCQYRYGHSAFKFSSSLPTGSAKAGRGQTVESPFDLETQKTASRAKARSAPIRPINGGPSPQSCWRFDPTPSRSRSSPPRKPPPPSLGWRRDGRSGRSLRAGYARHGFSRLINRARLPANNHERITLLSQRSCKRGKRGRQKMQSSRSCCPAAALLLVRSRSTPTSGRALLRGARP